MVYNVFRMKVGEACPIQPMYSRDYEARTCIPCLKIMLLPARTSFIVISLTFPIFYT
jgi:hypothetical protein